ncbi:MAG: family acetyltransferase [Marmoricola sp.]|nr:family acetyltransferase [Marmoricola sp.]
MPDSTPTSRPVVLRALQERDWPQVHDLVVDVAREGRTYALEVPSEQAETRALWSGALLVVAVDGDVVLGAAKAGPNRPGPGSHVGTASFVVGADARGRGVGRSLGEHVVAWHREQGFRAIQFNAVVSTNAAAVRLWRSLGFEVVGTVPGGFALPEGEYADLLVMHLDLTAPATAVLEDPTVLDVAADAFVRWGWAGTTFDLVARLAQVSELELTRRFVSRGDLLIEVMRHRMAGEGADMRDALAAADVGRSSDPAVRREEVARFVLRMVRPIAPLVRALWQAADEDPVAEALRRGAELRRVGLSRALVSALAADGPVSPDAVGAVQTLTTAENYLCLTGLGWDDERYVRWLADALDHAVNGTTAEALEPVEEAGRTAGEVGG